MSAGADSVRLGEAFVELVLKDEKFQSQLAEIGSKIATWGARFLSVAVIEETIRRSITMFADLGGEMVKMQERTGIAAGTLMELSHAAKLSESDIGDVTMGVRFLQRNLVEAAQGSKEAQEKFDRLGISWQALSGKGGVEQLLAISDAFAKIPDAATRTAMSMELFERSGQSLVPFLKGGSKAILRLMAEARSLGRTLSEDAAKGADDLDDAFTRLESSVTGLKLAIGEAFGPSVVSMINKTAEAVKLFNSAVLGRGEVLRRSGEKFAGERTMAESIAGSSRGGPAGKVAEIRGASSETLDAARFRADVKTSEAIYKQQWESGKLSMERYYDRLHQLQRDALDFEVQQMELKRAGAKDSKEAAEADVKLVELTAQKELLRVQQGMELDKARKDAREKEKRDAEELFRSQIDATVARTEADADAARASLELKKQEKQVTEEQYQKERFEIDRKVLLQKKQAAEARGDATQAYVLQRQLDALGYSEAAALAGLTPAALGAPKGAAIGTFSGKLAGMAGFGVGDVFDQQLETLQGMSGTLDKIQKNTAEGLQ